jgi:hypothetical protein
MIKSSVSLAIRQGDRILIVKRPHDDEDLPDEWGLPAATVRNEESWQDAGVRAGREKLGVELEIGRELNRGSLQRSPYTIEMRLHEATIITGLPRVPQPETGVTQYQEWKWGVAADLKPAANKGSLCCRLLLDV